MGWDYFAHFLPCIALVFFYIKRWYLNAQLLDFLYLFFFSFKITNSKTFWNSVNVGFCEGFIHIVTKLSQPSRQRKRVEEEIIERPAVGQTVLTCFVSTKSVASMLAFVISSFSITSATSGSLKPYARCQRSAQDQYKHINLDGLKDF